VTHLPAETPVAEPTTIAEVGASLDCSIVPWDTRIFGFAVAAIERFELNPAADPAKLLDRLESWCRDRSVRLVTCRLDHLRLRESMALEQRGFRFIEMVYRPTLASLDALAEPRHVIHVRPATDADLPAIERIAAEAFTTGRFLLDWRLPPELSRRRYAWWVRHTADSPEQTVVKAEADGNLIGFFIVEAKPDQSVYWHLTALAPDAQGRGLGSSVWQTMLRRHRAEGATGVRTTISGHNPAVINLYARLGFRFESPEMTFHLLRDVQG
jgi:L-amino acid N-acyltransferase YncA